MDALGAELRGEPVQQLVEVGLLAFALFALGVSDAPAELFAVDAVSFGERHWRRPQNGGRPRRAR